MQTNVALMLICMYMCGAQADLLFPCSQSGIDAPHFASASPHLSSHFVCNATIKKVNPAAWYLVVNEQNPTPGEQQ